MVPPSAHENSKPEIRLRGKSLDWLHREQPIPSKNNEDEERILLYTSLDSAAIGSET
jgi:hypothetical protein